MFSEQELHTLINRFLEDCQRSSGLNEEDLRDIRDEFNALQPEEIGSGFSKPKFLAVLTFDCQTDHRRSAHSAFQTKQICRMEREYFDFIATSSSVLALTSSERRRRHVEEEDDEGGMRTGWQNRVRKRLLYRTWYFMYRTDLDILPLAIKKFLRKYSTGRVLQVYRLVSSGPDKIVWTSLLRMVVNTLDVAPTTRQQLFTRIYGQHRAIICTYENECANGIAVPTDVEMLKKLESVFYCLKFHCTPINIRDYTVSNKNIFC